jgi:3-methyladenine DNA glycosylase/8-oxoguanine DNA glycosylase
MPTRLSIPVPADYVLRRDLCSYGYFLLDPNFWDGATETFARVLDLDGGPATLHIRQEPAAGVRPNSRSAHLRGRPLRVVVDRGLSPRERTQVKAMLTRMLRLDEPAETIAEFHTLDPRWRPSGRGRLMRSPTFFEDVIKTVTSCNVTWPSTVIMNRRLCEVVGRGGAFPTSRRIARTRAGTLRARCRVGYRDARILELAGMFASGEIEPQWFEDPQTPDAALWERLLSLPGIGPYAAANIMQLLGRYHRLPLDSESIRHGKAVMGLKGTDRVIMQRMHAHFEPFGRHAFRSYWFELWVFYEEKRGPSWAWERQTTGTSFTASKLK